METLRLPKLDEKELQPLTIGEELDLLNVYSELKPQQCRDKALLMLLLSTGLRRAEVIGLKVIDVNLLEGFITVWGKGKKQRSVPFGHKGCPPFLLPRGRDISGSYSRRRRAVSMLPPVRR